MMYPFLTLDDGTEIVHSEMLPDARVKVYMERPDEIQGFLHATGSVKIILQKSLQALV